VPPSQIFETFAIPGDRPRIFDPVIKSGIDASLMDPYR
jgi:hypothetical protein